MSIVLINSVCIILILHVVNAVFCSAFRYLFIMHVSFSKKKYVFNAHFKISCAFCIWVLFMQYAKMCMKWSGCKQQTPSVCTEWSRLMVNTAQCALVRVCWRRTGERHGGRQTKHGLLTRRRAGRWPRDALTGRAVQGQWMLLQLTESPGSERRAWTHTEAQTKQSY